MATLKEAPTEVARELFGYRNHTAATLAINGAGAATFKTTSAYAYTNDGIYKSKTALAAQAFSSGHAVQGTSQTRYYVVGLDGSGTVTTYQGAAPNTNAITEALVNGQAASSVKGSLPDVPNGVTPVGLIKVVTDSATTFTPGTTALDAAGLTVTFYDIALIPSSAP
jgi:hypothetical protein